MNDLFAKLERLVHAKAINISTKETGRTRHKSTKLLPLAKQEQPKIGDFCRSIVVAKDESKKQLILHITFLLQGEKATYVNHMKHKGYIRDYDLKQEFSIFTYVGNFKQITLGSEIVAQVRNIVIRNQQNHYEFTLKCKKNQEGHFRAGVTRDQIDVSQRDWKIYEKYGYFSGIFLAQYEQDFANPGLPHRLCKEMRIGQSESLDVESLLGSLDSLSLDYQRVRQLQEKQWADKHFMEGLKFLKAEKPDIALEHLNMARSFDKHSSKIYIARGCALANMNNFAQGLRQIKEALRLSPNNKEALRYLDEIRKEIRDKDHREREQEDSDRSRKVRVNNEFQPTRRK